MIKRFVSQSVRRLFLLNFGIVFVSVLMSACSQPDDVSKRSGADSSDRTSESAAKTSPMPPPAPTAMTEKTAPSETDATAQTPEEKQGPWQLPVKPAEGVMVPLVYTGNLNGELEPCGCTVESDYGGIQRRAEAIERLRKTFDSVDGELLLLSTGGLLDDFGASEAIKNNAILSGMQKMGYDGIGVQPRDLFYGVDFITGKSLPWINSSPLPPASLPTEYKEESGEVFQPFASHIVVNRANTDFAIFSILPEEALFSMGAKTGAEPDYSAIVAKMKEKVENDNVVILMSAMPASALKQKIDFHHVDILITPSDDEYFPPPQWLQHTLWLRPGHRGMRMGVAQLKLTGAERVAPVEDPHAGLNIDVKSYRSKAKNQVALVSHEVIALDRHVPDNPGMAEWYAQYNKAVQADYEKRSELQKQYQAGAEQVYAGAQVCAGCHQAVFEHWQQTDHSKAIQTLVDKDKAFDPACLKCHTVAFHEPGGFIDIDVTDHLANVQCENCHVETAAHVKNPALNKPKLAKESPEKICVQCHNKTHSPSFNFDTYWPRIAHDLQGALNQSASENKANSE